jgi:hypothetical protein
MGQIRTNNEQFETGIIADHRGQLLAVGPDSGSVDAFGRARMSEPFTIFDSTLRYTKRTDQWFESATLGGSTNYLANESSLELTTGTASGSTMLRRTKRRFPYQPGKSMLVMQSFVGTTASGVKQEVGLFDNENGIMVRCTDGEVQFAIRSFATGSVQEETASQASWNIDTLDELDFSKANIFIADLEWLGVGRVRCGFVVDGEIKWCHEFNHANASTKVYATTAILPLSYRIENTSSQASGQTLKQICCSVQSEGGYEPVGPMYFVGRGAVGAALISTETVVAGIRMASGRTGNVIMPAQVDAVIEGNTVAQWRLRLNPTVSGSWIAAENGRGNVETIITATTFSGGTIVAAGLVGNNGSSAFTPETALALSLGVDASGNSDVLVLTVEADSATKATGLIGWKELV